MRQCSIIVQFAQMTVMRRAGVRTIQLLPRISWLGATDACSLQGKGSIQIFRGYADQADLKKTPLYDFHVEQGGKTLRHWNGIVFQSDSKFDKGTWCVTDVWAWYLSKFTQSLISFYVSYGIVMRLGIQYRCMSLKLTKIGDGYHGVKIGTGSKCHLFVYASIGNQFQASP